MVVHEFPVKKPSMLSVAVWLHTMFENYGCRNLQKLVIFPTYPLKVNETIYLYHDLKRLVITRDYKQLHFDINNMSDYTLALVRRVDKNIYQINFTYNI